MLNKAVVNCEILSQEVDNLVTFTFNCYIIL